MPYLYAVCPGNLVSDACCGFAEPPKTGGPSLTLSEAFQLAWKENANLKVSRLQELIAEQERIRARSGFLPSIKANTIQQIYDDPQKICLSRVRISSLLPF